MDDLLVKLVEGELAISSRNWRGRTRINGEIEPLLIFDDDHQSYQLMYIGWDGRRRVHTPIIHIRLRHDKIWIESDGTQEGVAMELLAAGVPKEDIVLAFHSPEKRKYTEFAVA